MGVIFWGSTESFSGEATAARILPLLRALLPWADLAQLELLHAMLRKGGHVLEYGILAWLWFRAFSPAGHPRALPRIEGTAQGSTEGGLSALKSNRHALAAFAISVAYAGLDELHQAWTRVRTGSLRDVLWDAAGAAAALGLLPFGWKSTATLLTTILLWIGALGGTLLLLLALLAGAPARWLWASAPLAWVALVGWRWLRRNRQL
jgi:VanZ family protein